MCDQDREMNEKAAAWKHEKAAAVAAQQSRGETLANPSAMLRGTVRAFPSNEEIVSHHSPGPEEIQRITTIRAAARNFLDAIDANCPRSADADAAKRHVREAMMTANAAIVLHGLI